MRTRMEKRGSALYDRIPQSIARKAGLRVGEEFDLAVDGGILVIRKADHKLSLEELLEQVTDANLHAEIGVGESREQETW